MDCSYFKKYLCRSCSLLSLNTSKYNSLKIEQFLDTLKPVIESGTEIKELYQAKTTFPSRAKARLSVSGEVNNPVIGLLDDEFNGIELLDCPLHFDIINQLLNELPQIISDYKLQPYNIASKKGELKGVIINSNSDSSEMMLRFILRSTEAIARINKAVPRLVNNHPQLKVVTANVQATPHQIPEGEEEHVLTETQYIREKYGEIDFCLGPQCFSQVTPVVANALYHYVQGIIKKEKPELVLDIFCGVGGFALFAAKFAKHVIGVEYSSNAIEAAKLSAEKNRIKNANFFTDDAEKFLESFDRTTPCAVICNPPRRGLSDKILDSILDLAPRSFIYSSCNPETLARDIAAISDDYKLLSLAPFDMFPLTKHLEVVAHMEKRSSD